MDIELIKQAQEQAEAQAIADYKQLILDSAGGKEIVMTTVLRILREADQSPDNLEHDVQRVLYRRALRAEADTAPQHEARIKELHEQIAGHKATMMAAKDAYASAVTPLQSQGVECEEKLQSARNALAELKSTGDVELQEQIAMLRPAELTQQITRLRHTAESLENEIQLDGQRGRDAQHAIDKREQVLAEMTRLEGEESNEQITALEEQLLAVE